MGFNLIERYIFRRAFVATALTLGCLVGVVWIIQALRKLDIITSKGQAILLYLQLTMLTVPMLSLAVIPLALLVATIYAINSLNANSELVVINASGASGWILAKPLLALALLCSLFVGFVGHFVIAWSLVSLKSKVTEMQTDLVSLVVQEGAFNDIEPGLTFHIAKRDAGGLLRGVLISDERDKEASIVYSAAQGIVTRRDNESVLLLRNGEIHRRNHRDRTVTVINYQSYAFDLSTFAGKVEKLTLRPKERTTPDLLDPDPDDHYFRTAPGLYRAAIHERFSEMLWPFVYVMVVLAFAGQARSNRQSYGSAIVAAVGAIILLRGFAFSSLSSLKTDASAVTMVYGLPLFGMATAGWFLARNRPVALPSPVAVWIDAQQGRALSKAAQLYDGYLVFRRRRAGVQM